MKRCNGNLQYDIGIRHHQQHHKPNVVLCTYYSSLLLKRSAYDGISRAHSTRRDTICIFQTLNIEYRRKSTKSKSKRNDRQQPTVRPNVWLAKIEEIHRSQKKRNLKKEMLNYCTRAMMFPFIMDFDADFLPVTLERFETIVNRIILECLFRSLTLEITLLVFFLSFFLSNQI